jgi:UDP-N-acetylmuramate dehydrogenase
VLNKVLASYLKHICGDKNVRENEPLSRHSTWGIGGPAEFFVFARTREVLVRTISALEYIEHPYRVIGSGSNILFADKGFAGVIIRAACDEFVENGNFIYVGAGAILSTTARKVATMGLSGLEFASGIPGTVGGAIFGNAGAHGAQISDVVAMVDVYENGQITAMDTRACKFGYRTSIFKRRHAVILGAYFSLRQAPRETIEQKAADYIARRAQTQPAGKSAGCVFRNPSAVIGGAGGVWGGTPHISAGKLIDDLNLKGTRIGGAIISDRHANFILNDGNATAADIMALIKLIKKRVHDAHGITLKSEIQVIRNYSSIARIKRTIVRR